MCEGELKCEGKNKGFRGEVKGTCAKEEMKCLREKKEVQMVPKGDMKNRRGKCEGEK